MKLSSNIFVEYRPLFRLETWGLRLDNGADDEAMSEEEGTYPGFGVSQAGKKPGGDIGHCVTPQTIFWRVIKSQGRNDVPLRSC